MSKSLIISLAAIVIGLITIAVGLYVLSITPAPELGPDAADPFVVVPQLSPDATDPGGQDVPSVDTEPGSEPWCEQMMLLPDAQWSEPDTRLFAQQCLY